MNDISIIYKDDNLVAINKPVSLLVHRTKIDNYDSLNAIKIIRNYINQKVYPIHRLDKATSGVLLFALNEEILKKMNNLFLENKIEKKYLGIVRGFTKNDEIIDYPLIKINHSKNNLSFIKDIKQSAITCYKLLEKIEINEAVGKYKTARYSFIDIMPKTGRYHQIRRHLKHISHPIIGDTTYGDGRHNKFFKDYYNISRLLLHAYSLKFTNPIDNKTIEIKAPLDDDFRRIVDLFKWNVDAGLRIIRRHKDYGGH